MNNANNLRKNRIKVLLVDTVMVLSVIITVGVLLLITMGYNLTRNFKVEQQGLVQFASYPSGADVTVDEKVMTSRTSTKTMMTPGMHDFTISKQGYDSWSKQAEIIPGSVLWLNYARLVPTQKEITTIKNYKDISAVSSSPNSQYMLVFFDDLSLSPQLLDVKGEDVKSQGLSIKKLFSKLDNSATKHSVEVVQWSADSTKILIKHHFGESFEWILIDTKSISSSLNISNAYKLTFTDIELASDDGRKLFVLENHNLRRADTQSKTVSAVLLENVAELSVINKDTIVFLSTEDKNGLVNIGVFKDGEKGASTLYSVESKAANIKVAGGRYYNKDYVVISEGSDLIIMRGTLPSFGKPSSTLAQWKEVTLDFDIEHLSMDSKRRFIMASNRQNIYNYDLETSNGSSFQLDGAHEHPNSFNWLDDFIIYSTADDKLTIYDFDGKNKRQVMDTESGTDVVVTQNDKYIYAITPDLSDQSGKWSKLIRLNMIAKD
jgi:PEGA domain.